MWVLFWAGAIYAVLLIWLQLSVPSFCLREWHTPMHTHTYTHTHEGGDPLGKWHAMKQKIAQYVLCSVQMSGKSNFPAACKFGFILALAFLSQNVSLGGGSRSATGATAVVNIMFAHKDLRAKQIRQYENWKNVEQCRK